MSGFQDRLTVAALIGVLSACDNSSAPSSALVITPPPALDLSRQVVAYRASGLAATAPDFETRRHGTGIRAMEPSFAITPGGQILYQGWQLNDQAAGGVPAVPVVVRSVDGGSQWEDVTPWVIPAVWTRCCTRMKTPDGFFR